MASRLAGAGRRRRGWHRGSSVVGLLCERRWGTSVEDGVTRGSSAARLLCERRRGSSAMWQRGSSSATSAPGLLCDAVARLLCTRLQHGGARVGLDRWGSGRRSGWLGEKGARGCWL
jgi:hypothetical protein